MAGKVSSDPNVFLLPDLGEGLEEAELIEWCVTEGQTIKEFDLLAKMETDKALSDVPSPRGGTIATLHGKPGEKIKVGAPLVTFKGEGAATAPSAPKVQASEQKPVQRSMNQSAPAAKHESKEEEREDAGTVVGSVQSAGMFEAAPGKVIATPAVRRIARDLGVDLSQITGSAIGGRIVEADVRAFAGKSGGGNGSRDHGAVAEPPPSARPPMRESRPAPASAARSVSHSSLGAPGSTQRIPFRGIRRTIAERLRQSVNAAVHFYVMDEVDASQLD